MPIAVSDGMIIGDPGNGMFEDYVREKNIKAHERQEEVLRLPDDVFECLYGGAAYGGKSWLLTMLPLFRGFYKYRGFKGIILRRKFPDLEREIIRLSKEYYPQTGGKYNDQKHSWEWPQYGSYMDFGHVQHNTDITMYDSAQYNYGAFDELTHFDAYPYHYMVGTRIRPGGDFHISFVRNGTNPGGIGQTFVYNRFIQPCEDGYKLIRDRSTGLLRIFIPALIEDNPYGLKYDPEYAKKMEILKVVSPAEYRAKRYGDWHAFKGSVFTTFRVINLPGEPDNALHVIQPFAIPEWWPRVLSIDWGKTAMCYAMWGAISPDKRVFVYRERAWKGADIAKWASEIREIHEENTETPQVTVLCGSAWQDRGGTEIQEDFTKYSGLVAISSANSPGSRVANLQVVHDFMRWEQKTRLFSRELVYDMGKAQTIYRKFGPEALERYRAQFIDEPEEQNIPILQIFNTCKVLIDTIPMAVYDEKKTEDIADFDGDDPLDCLKYFCRVTRRFVTGEIGNIEHTMALNQVIAHYAANQDTTAFYRQMEVLENGNNIINMGKQIRPQGLLARRRAQRYGSH